ncbi:MAG: fibronectin type III domain-containing protein, partial [Acidobacteriaceae bacterium]
IAADGTYADLAHLEATQVTAFAPAGDTLYVATSNIGKLYKFAPLGKSASSTSISPVHDAKFFSQWGRAQVRGSGSYDLFARFGNIEQPTEGWSEWQKVTPGVAAATLPRARFLQWRAVLHPGSSLNDVGFYYLPQNVAPVVDQTVLALHTRVNPGMNTDPQSTPVAISFPPSTSDGVTYTESSPSSSPLIAQRSRGWATLRWKAHDDNGDILRYSLYYRGDGEANWQLLQSGIHSTHASIDLTRIPDGGYTLRVVASDAPSHPAGDALTGYRDSEYFLLDTTPPALSTLHATLQGSSIHFVFDAHGKLSTIARAYYSIDAGPWQYMEPVNHLSDSLEEHYDTTVPVPRRNTDTEIAPAISQQHVIAVRVVDRAGNAATEKAIVE